MSEARFHLLEATVADIHAAYLEKTTTCRELTELYLNRIERYDRNGPLLNSILTVYHEALEEADRLDAALADGGLVGPLHGIPVILKDQIDAVGMPTTLGSVMFRDYYPDQDATVVRRLKDAGALVLAKATLGELAAGDTHGSLFGSTRNPYDLVRTPGGSSGGPAVAMAANLGTLAIGQEGFASIRRPAAWCDVVGMRPSGGLVPRTGSYDGWPGTAGSLGPITRTVADAARLLDVLVGPDPEDPLTTSPAVPAVSGFAAGLRADGLQGVRVGVLRRPMGVGSDPDSTDFRNVTAVFDRAVGELADAGAVVVDDVVIPDLDELLAHRASPDRAVSLMTWLGRSRTPPFRSHEELVAHPAYAEATSRRATAAQSATPAEHRAARTELHARVLAVMDDLGLDVLVHKSVEHTATLIEDGLTPPYVGHRGATHLNTFLEDVPAISVPAGYAVNQMPVGITFLGRPYADAAVLRYAYAYEQATHHRQVPWSTPALPGEF